MIHELDALRRKVRAREDATHRISRPLVMLKQVRSDVGANGDAELKRLVTLAVERAELLMDDASVAWLEARKELRAMEAEPE